MAKNKGYKWGIVVILGIFLMGVAVPVFAGISNESGEKAGFFQGFQGKKLQKDTDGRMQGPGPGAFCDSSVIEELTGLDADAIKAELEAGKTMKEIMEEAGVTQEEVQSKMQEQREVRLQALLDEGTITQEQYDELITKEAGPRMQGPGHGHGQFGDSSVIEELTGLDADAIKAELEAGKTMEEILEEAGVTQEEVQSKMQEQREARLQTLLDEGTITQEQYDELITKEAGPRMQGPGHGQGRFGDSSVIEELTGLDADAIKAELEAGKTMKEILEEAGVTQEEVQSKMQEQREARLQALLDEGTITQEQYDELITKTPANAHIKMKAQFKGYN